MDFKTFWTSLSPAERETFAESCDSTVGYLRNLAYEGRRHCSVVLALKIEQNSDGKVSRKDVCPDVDWTFVRDMA
jgi:hypothetical protein